MHKPIDGTYLQEVNISVNFFQDMRKFTFLLLQIIQRLRVSIWILYKKRFLMKVKVGL